MKNMKKMFNALLVLALICATGVFIVYAASPTVTRTLYSGFDRAQVYSFSYGTNITNVDTAYIYNTGSGPFNVQNMGLAGADTMVTLELYTSEATADSVRHAILFQVSSKTSPNCTERSLTGSNQDWITVAIDSASFNNSALSTSPKFIKFAKTRLAGRVPHMRVVIYEIGTVAKDANQTITGRLDIPKWVRF